MLVCLLQFSHLLVSILPFRPSDRLILFEFIDFMAKKKGAVTTLGPLNILPSRDLPTSEEMS